VEAVEQRVATLDFMCLDGIAEHVAHAERRAALTLRLAAEIIAQRENGAQVVRGMAPLGGKPGVVEVEPANLRADGKGCLHGIELMAGARYACATGKGRAWHEGPEML